MKVSIPGQFRAHLAVVLLFSLGLIGVQAENKYIRLRNQLITTATPSLKRAAVQGQSLETPVSGLYLVQFTDHLRPDWRAQLQEKHVQLLRFVPDDAFIARLDNVRVSELRTLGFVRWVGEYGANYKVHPNVRHALANWRMAGSAKLPSLRVLLSPLASPEEVRMLRRSLSLVHAQTRYGFGIILEGQATPAQLVDLAKSASVIWIESTPKPKLLDEVSSRIVAGDPTTTNQNGTATQLLGFDGRGVVVSVADTGLNNGDAATMHPDLAGRVDAFLHYGTLIDAADEHSHGTHVAGIIAGNGATGETDDNGLLYGLGVAPGAHLVVQRVFDADGNDNLPAPEVLTHDAVRAGAVIGSNSWGDDTQGAYDLNAAIFDALVRDADALTPGDQPYILEFSAGNAGPGSQTIDSPASAKNVLATGASQNNRFDFFIYDQGQEAMADFSSRGPCEDGRIKPDVVAPGTWIASLQSASATDQNAWLPIDSNYQYQGGTSQAGPHASGAAAVFVQYYRQTHGNVTPSPALVKAALINSAVELDGSFGTGPVPNFDEGWGRIDLTELIGSARRYEFVDQTELLQTGQTYEHTVIVGSSDAPLKITLAYTDVPGLPAAIPALVNDLDLEVVAPDGRVYRGNQFDGGESSPDVSTSDNLNNVEGIRLSAPLPGEYLVRVRARNVVEDARRETTAIDQDFALVISADIPLPGSAVLIMDRAAYRAPDLIHLKLIDHDLAGQKSATVHITSSTETNGEVLILSAYGTAGVFTGAVATALGPPIQDGVLQVRDGDQIQATYQDASPAATVTISAPVDLAPPVVTGVTVTNQFGKTIITWQTDEPANGVVRYGTNQILTLSVTNASLNQTQQVVVDNLIAGATYQFLIISTDAAGNSTTNNNNNRLFTFVPAKASTVLLVNGYVPDDFSTEIPVTTYTDPLDQTGVSYQIWNINALQRSPTVLDLRPFRVVIWRLNDSFGSTTSLSAAEQNAIRDYLKGGGSFFMGSMQVLSRLGDISFRTNVLHVASFAEDVGVPSIDGVPNDPITSAMSMDLDFAAYPTLDLLGIGPDLSATMTLTTNAAPIFLDGVSNHIAGLRFPRTGQDSNGRLVFLSFPFDAIPDTGVAPNNRENVLQNILSFLAPGLNGLSSIAFDDSVYTIPALVTVEVADAGRTGQGQAAVMFYSDTATNGQSLIISETSRPGLFRGHIALVSVTNLVHQGQIRARDGDAVWATYLSATSSSPVRVSANLIRVSATVDTHPPAITNVVVVPDYENAEVSWDTSKAADGLVQFGESTFLGRTAYSASFDQSHSLTLAGLQPNRSYYYQIVSRDAAGNATVDDKNGKFYTFTTLKPLATPWFDSFERGLGGWTVVNGESAVTTWRLGAPQNDLATSAFSPTNAWGTNLKGDSIDTADTMLVSPGIELSGGNRATLQFEQVYDFTDKSQSDILETGTLSVSTNNGDSWIQLAAYTGMSSGWEQAKIDLTPYLGHVVRLGWQYALFTLEANIHPGWIIDDVSVTVTNLVRGVIEVTNNLSQAHFTLTGPITQAGEGWKTVIQDAPPGQYVVTFDPVPFYLTPSPETNVISSTNLLVFRGDYTFPDVNHNGISDLWEQQFFGGVFANRTATTDSDGDGATDYAEFRAGTNPTDPSSALAMSPPIFLPNRTVRLGWPSSLGYSYRLEGTTNSITWVPFSDWMRATHTNSSIVLPPLIMGPTYSFRLEVRP